MPNIPFPNIPPYPGVPALTRPVSAAIASVPALAIIIGTVETILGAALQQAPRWGIFDAAGNQLGVSSTGGVSILSALASQLTGQSGPVLSTWGFDFTKEMRVSDFPVEGGTFATYNKVETPSNPVVTLALSGTEDDRTFFLNALDDACLSTQLYNVLTPEVQFVNYSIERYTYSRRADRGATLLIVDVSLKQVRTVTASLTQAAAPIVSPQNPGASAQVNGGMTQSAIPDISTVRSFTNKISQIFGGN